VPHLERPCPRQLQPPARTPLSLLKNETTLKVGIKNKRLNAGWDETYLQKVLGGS
jgi:hypothetical protein